MQHTVAFTVAPVVTVFDDQGQIIQAFMLPIQLILAFPCGLWLALAGLRLLAGDFDHWLTGYIAGWRADLALMGEAALGILRAIIPSEPFPQLGKN